MRRALIGLRHASGARADRRQSLSRRSSGLPLDCTLRGDHRRRRAAHLHRRRVDSRQGDARRDDGRSRRDLSAVRLRLAQGLQHAAALRGARQATAPRRSIAAASSRCGSPSAARPSRLHSSYVRCFVHLHLHTEYSLVDSVVRIQSEGGDAPGLMDAVAAAGMPAVALTDQSNLFAMVKFYKAAQSAGVKPIIGVDLRVRELGERAEPSTLVLLCQNEIGYRNLTRLVSRSYLEGQHTRPRDHRSQLAHRRQPRGLIALVRRARRRRRSRDRATAARRTRAARSISGSRCSAIATTSSCSAPVAKARSATSTARCELAVERGVPVVATNDVRFIRARGFRIARSARLHSRRRAARRPEAPPPLQRSSST